MNFNNFRDFEHFSCHTHSIFQQRTCHDRKEEGLTFQSLTQKFRNEGNEKATISKIEKSCIQSPDYDIEQCTYIYLKQFFNLNLQLHYIYFQCKVKYFPLSFRCLEMGLGGTISHKMQTEANRISENKKKVDFGKVQSTQYHPPSRLGVLQRLASGSSIYCRDSVALISFLLQPLLFSSTNYSHLLLLILPFIFLAHCSFYPLANAY